MLISNEVTNVSAEFTLTRTGDQVAAAFSYGLTGYYDPDQGFYLWDGDLGGNIGDDGDYFSQQFDRPMDLFFTATLVPGTTEDGSYSVNDYIGGAGFTHDFKVVVFSAADSYTGGDLPDYVFGSDFGDAIAGGLGDDNAELGAGNDTGTGGGGNDTLAGDAGVDSLSGGGGGDRLNGGLGIDLVSGGTGDDRLLGGFGQDLLSGNAGYDTIIGGGGADTIDGGGRGDRLVGGSGRDVFHYSAPADSTNLSFGHDVIADFNSAQDKIDLHDLDAMAGTPDNQDFTFIGGAEFSAEGQVRFVQAGSDGYILVNTAGTGTAEMAIELVGVTAVSEVNFIL